MRKNDNVILYICHYINDNIKNEFLHLKNSLHSNYDIVFCIPAHNKYIVDYSDVIDFFEYDESMVKHGVDEILHFEWYNPERVLEDFYKEFDEYDFYYVVEYDVYTKNWGKVFNIIDESVLSNTDLLASHMYRLNEGNQWCYYVKYKGLYPDDKRKCFSALLSFMRISNRAMKYILSCMDDKITDEIAELYYPTLLYNGGFILQSLSKDEFFGGYEIIEDEKFNVNNCYTNPEILFEEGKLYHRLKSSECLSNWKNLWLLKTAPEVSFTYKVCEREFYNSLMRDVLSCGFSTFEIYNLNETNNFMCYKFQWDIFNYLNNINEDCIIKCLKEFKGLLSSNYYDSNVNIIHLNCFSKELFDLNLLNTNKVCVPENVTIITVENQVEKSPLIKQLTKSNIKFVNGCETDEDLPDLNGDKLILKVDYIYEALKKVDTEYVLFLDSRDTIIFNLDNLIENYSEYGYDIIFGNDPSPFPENFKTVLEQNHSNSFINSGTIFGKTDSMLSVFGKISKLRKTLGIVHCYGTHSNGWCDSGDQGFIRRFVDIINGFGDNNVIGIDVYNKLFMVCLYRPMFMGYGKRICLRN